MIEESGIDVKELLAELTSVRETLMDGMIRSREEVDHKSRRVASFIKATQIVNDALVKYPLDPSTQ